MRAEGHPHPTSLRLVEIVLIVGIFASLVGCQSGGLVAAPTSIATPAQTVSTASGSTKTVTSQPTLAVTSAPPSLSPTASTLPSQTASPTSDPNQVYYPAGRVSVPILLYHNISDHGNNRYITTSKAFHAEMEALHQNGCHTITISQLADVIRHGGELPKNPVVLTFDDGYLGVYENALPILNDYGFVGVMYVITSTLDSATSYGYVQKNQLVELVDAGWEIGSHSVTHSDLKTSKLGMQNELVQSRNTLETLLGTKVRSFAYPYATANTWTRERTEEYGYDSAVGIDIYMTHSPKSLFYLSRREVPRSISAADFLALLVPGKFELAGFPLITATPTP
jgi:peptidoglycan/xylan/chitin deacetylase (PgdA/CDA1 family)